MSPRSKRFTMGWGTLAGLGLVGLWLQPAASAPPPSGSTTMTEIKYRTLSPEEARVIEGQGTERAFTGRYWNHKAAGTYHCKRCNAPLFPSGAKFDSGTGWPSFDDALPGAIREVPDPDGHRTEIRCARCGGHLGHVFRGEGFTDRGVRHCVNSVSLEFEPATSPAPTAKPSRTEDAYFAGGCFWGVEYFFDQVPGVISAVSGYMGGARPSPTYEQVCTGATGHLETVRVTYDPGRVTYRELARLFFEIHDPTQADGQGPDIGEQYRSALFTASPAQEQVARELIGLLRQRGHAVVTELRPAGPFWEAEAYHQDHYALRKTLPYCHRRVDRFGP